ncbi:MAG: hypothetical protein ACOYXO_19470 [Chloroflexota bacterium]
MLVNRVGVFFLLVGGFLLLLFVFSAQSETGGVSALFLWGVIFFFLGAILWWRSPKPPKQPVERFRLLRQAGKKKGKGGETPATREKDQRRRPGSG